MTFLTLEASISVTGPDMTGKPVLAMAGAAAAAGALNFSTSLEVIIPSIPDPALIRARSSPLSAASLLAAGLANGLPPPGLALTGAGAAAAGAGAAAAGAAAGASETPSSTKSLNLATSSWFSTMMQSSLPMGISLDPAEMIIL